MTAALLAFAVVPAVSADPTEPKGGRPALDPENLRAGLVSTYRSLTERAATFTRVDPKPAFYLGHSSPDPRLPPGPVEVAWSGFLHVKDPGPITFEAFVGGQVRMEVDGALVLEGRGETDTSRVRGKKPLDRPPGHYRVKILFRSLADVPARLQLWWQGPTFAQEPIPPWHFNHLGTDRPPAAKEEELRAQGRAAVGRLGCARCHNSALPGVAEPPPGPALADVRSRLRRAWLLHWLEDPAKVHADAHMPALFPRDRTGFVERWLIADYLLGPPRAGTPATAAPAGDHRAGRLAFLSLGCAACHQVPDLPRSEQADLERWPLRGLADRMRPADLAAFLGNPHGRYPDGRMPRLPMPPDTARDIAAYLLVWSGPTADLPAAAPPTPQEIAALVRQLRAPDQASAGPALLHSKGCAACHPGLGATAPLDIPLKRREAGTGCVSGTAVPRFALDPQTRKAIAAYLQIASRERYPSPFATRQRLLQRAGCTRCHQRDSDRPPAIEIVGSTLGGAFLQDLPFQRTPRLTYPHQRLLRSYLVSAVREGVSGLRPARYTYRMPAFGQEAEALVQAIAEGDGELPAGPEPAPPHLADPTLGPLAGRALAGFQGYACVSCHVWNGRLLAQPDPGAIGTDLTKVPGRIHREWLDRFLEDPSRSYPGTPMPAIFTHGKPASLSAMLDGDPTKQRDALWSYFALGRAAPSPQPPPPFAIESPPAGAGPLVALISIRVPTGATVESITLLYSTADLIVYDIGAGALHSVYAGGQILRGEQGRLRTFTASGKAVLPRVDEGSRLALSLVGPDGSQHALAGRTLHGYDRLPDGVRIRTACLFRQGKVEVVETLRLAHEQGKRFLVQEIKVSHVPPGHVLQVKTLASKRGTTLTPDGTGSAAATFRHKLPPATAAPALKRPAFADPGRVEGSLERPGYRAVAYPRPKAAFGEDLVMPSAVAVHPRDGRVFVASMKTGALYVLENPQGDGTKARFRDYTGGLFQEAYALLAEGDALYVLHRRNLTRVTESKGDGRADRFDRVAALPHGVADTYDYAYGLVRDRGGAFVMSYAPYANQGLPGSGGAVRLVPGKAPEEVAFGFRNPFGWCTGPEGEVFFTDNQGEWVPTNKLCHLVPGRFYGFPNPAQKQHTGKRAGKAAVWIPYGWARSVNGVAYDNPEGKFGPFAGQFFLAELMFGGALLRANLERVNGEYQGACFPFWGKGLLGPLTLAFDRRGHLYVGSITEPGWMAQPDRGALYRLDFTGQVPFEIQSLHVRPQGFRVVFTRPVAMATARDPASYHIEHFRYEYSGAYGSPELDRTQVPVRHVKLAADGRSAELTTAPLVRDRVYLISAPGVRSPAGEALVHATGAYTLNEIPAAGK
jgi:glucose/arabinose dehydrogenase/cytochrome c551/c552